MSAGSQEAPVEYLSRAGARLVRSLQHRRGREKTGCFLAEGERLVRELLVPPVGNSPAPRHRLLYIVSIPRHHEWIQRDFPQTELFEVDEREATTLFATDHSQGVVAVLESAEPPTVSDILASDEPAIYIDRLADPGNLGTIIRSADWFGCGGLLLSEGSVDLYNPKVIRATMGGIFRVQIATGVRPNDILVSGRPLIALDTSGDMSLGVEQLPPRGVYILGGEAHGVLPELRERATALSIPGRGSGESLNAAIAASIMLYELSQQSLRDTQ